MSQNLIQSARDQLGLSVIVIPKPVQLPVMRGAKSLKLNGVNVALRVHVNDYDLIKQVCAREGLTVGTFLRWCAVMSAADLEYIHTGKRPAVRC